MEYNSAQLTEIEYGIADGLTPEQIDVYRSNQFDEEQMEAIRVGLTLGASIQRMKKFCTKDLDGNVLRIIGWAIKNDFSDVEIIRIINNEEPYEVYEQLLIDKGL